MYDPSVKYTSELLAGMTHEGLVQLCQEARRCKLGFEMVKASAGGYFERTHLFQKVRRDIARIQTEINRAAGGQVVRQILLEGPLGQRASERGTQDAS